MGRSFFGDALIALAVVVGADVEDGVVLAVVPAYESVVFLDKGEKVVARLSHLAALLHLCQEPRAGDDGMGLEQLEARRGAHLARDDALEVSLYGQLIDGAYLVRLHHKVQGAEEGLCLLAFPMEVDAYGHVAEREGGVGALRMEGERAVLVAVPQDAALGERHFLFARHHLALGKIRLVEREVNLLSAHDAHVHVGLFALAGKQLERMLVGGCGRGLEIADDGFHLLCRNAALAQQGCGFVEVDLAEVFLARSDDQSCHVERSWRNHHLGLAFGEIGVRAVLLSRDDDADKLVAFSPGDDVHHGLALVATHRHGAIEAMEEFLVAVLALRDDDEGRHEEVAQHGNLLLVVERDDVGEVAREALPVGLQGQHAACASLEVQVVGG